MGIMIVYDSFFGNTEKIAQAISDSLKSEDNVETFRVSDIKPEQLLGVKLLIVGSPTRAFKPTKAILDLLNRIPSKGLEGVKVAAFDTRISTVDANSRILNILVKQFGYAAEPIGEKLKKKGGRLIITPEGFFVKDSEGPLKDGELERARVWAKQTIKS